MRFQLRMGISQQFMLLIGGVGIFMLLISGGLLLGLGYQDDRSEAITAQRDAACRLADGVESYLQEHRHWLELVRTQYTLAPETIPTLLQSLLLQAPEIEELVVVDATGTPLHQARRNDAESILLAIETHDLRSQVDQAALLRQEEQFLILLTIALPDGEGVVSALLNNYSLVDVMQTDVPNTSSNAYLINANNTVFASLNVIDAPIPLDRVRSGGVYENQDQVMVVGATCAIADSSWLGVVELPTSEAFVEDSAQRGGIWALLMLVTSVVIFILGYWLSRRVLIPLNQLTEGVAAISNGDLNHRLNMTRQDELGDLGRAFDAMTDTLQKRTLQLESLNTNLEERVEERTRESEDAKKRMEAIAEVLYRTHERANAANRARSQFIANMSHELRTPLNSMILIHDLFLRNTYGELTEKQIKKLTQSRNSAHMLLRLVNDVLDISKIDAGEMVVQRQPVNLKDLLKTSQDQIQPLIKEGVQFQIDVSRDLPDVLGDAQRIQQVLLNLLANAAKFTHEGNITLSAWEVQVHNGEVVNGKLPANMQILRDGNWVAVAVRDTGIGIPLDMHDLIFDQFKQVDDSNTRQYGGTGLGLPITKQLIEKQGGKIVVDSAPGQGSTFSFVLARVSEPPPTPA